MNLSLGLGSRCDPANRLLLRCRPQTQPPILTLTQYDLPRLYIHIPLPWETESSASCGRRIGEPGRIGVFKLSRDGVSRPCAVGGTIPVRRVPTGSRGGKFCVPAPVVTGAGRCGGSFLPTRWSGVAARKPCGCRRRGRRAMVAGGGW